MQCQVITITRRKGVGAESRRPYEFQTVGALITTANGVEFAEFMIDADAPTPESGKRYEIEFSFYPNREKKLMFRVEGLRPVPAGAIKAA